MYCKDGWLIVMLSGRNIVDAVIVDGKIKGSLVVVGMVGVLLLSWLENGVICLTGVAREE